MYWINNEIFLILRQNNFYLLRVMSTQKSEASNILRDFLAGGVSGALAKTIAAPIERVKLLL